MRCVTARAAALVMLRCRAELQASGAEAACITTRVLMGGGVHHGVVQGTWLEKREALRGPGARHIRAQKRRYSRILGQKQMMPVRELQARSIGLGIGDGGDLPAPGQTLSHITQLVWVTSVGQQG